jgi:hypothetical protein
MSQEYIISRLIKPVNSIFLQAGIRNKQGIEGPYGSLVF